MKNIKYNILFLLLLLPFVAYSQEPVSSGLFSGSTSKTWTTSESDTIYSDRLTIKQLNEEIGLYSLFFYGTGSTTISVKLQFYVKDPNVYSPVYNVVQGYTNGNSSLVSSFSPANGFEARIDNQAWWKYNQDGFRLVFIRSSSTEVTITYAGVRSI